MMFELLVGLLRRWLQLYLFLVAWLVIELGAAGALAQR
jgi:hypothetical protein